MNLMVKLPSMGAQPAAMPSTQQESVVLAQRVVAGDGLAQRELFHQLKPRLHATVYRILGSNGQIEDVLQETFIEIFRSLHTFRGDASLRTWGDRIAVRCAYRFLRRNQRTVGDVPLSPTLTLLGSAEDEILHREGVRRLYAVLEEMKPHYRIAFALFAIDGRSLKEVAEITSVTVIAAKARVWRARRQLEAAAREDVVLARYLERGES